MDIMKPEQANALINPWREEEVYFLHMRCVRFISVTQSMAQLQTG